MLNLSSANAFNLITSKILSFGKGLWIYFDRQELKTAQDEIDRVKELYVNLCEEKDQMKEKMDSEWIVKLEQSVQKVRSTGIRNY